LILVDNARLDKIKGMARRGLVHYKTNGPRFLKDMEAYLEEARRVGREVGEIQIDARTGDWNFQHPLTKSVLEASFAAEMVRRRKPRTVHDIGSNLVFLATLSSFVDVVGLDTRAVDFEKPGLRFMNIDARRLPFRDEEIEFVTSLCVVEHIGLGRYGDTIDPLGDYRFISEVRRCLRPGGVLIFSVPVANEAALVFNAHRLYSLSQIDDLIEGFSIAEEAFIKAGQGLLSRDQTMRLMNGDAQDYLVWIGCLTKNLSKGDY